MSPIPQNSNEVVVHLLALSRQLDETTQQLNEADMAAVNAGRTYGATLRSEIALAGSGVHGA